MNNMNKLILLLMMVVNGNLYSQFPSSPYNNTCSKNQQMTVDEDYCCPSCPTGEVAVFSTQGKGACICVDKAAKNYYDTCFKACDDLNKNVINSKQDFLGKYNSKIHLPEWNLSCQQYCNNQYKIINLK